MSAANSDNHNEYLFWLHTNTVFRFLSGEAWDSFKEWTITPIADDTWHHMAAVRDDTSNEVTLYVDGVSCGTKSMTLNTLSVTTGGLMLGQEQDAVGGKFEQEQSFKGMMDDLRIYNRALRASEVRELVHSTSGNTRKNP